MSTTMTVGSIQTTVTPPLASGIFEALLEKAERERDEAREAAAKWESSSDAMERAGAEQARRADENREWAVRAELERDEARAVLKVIEQAHHAALYREGELKRECAEACEESREQARLLGMGGEREARLITERDHYKQAVEHISTTIDDWLNSLIQEPPDDFIHAIKAWADKKLNNG